MSERSTTLQLIAWRAVAKSCGNRTIYSEENCKKDIDNTIKLDQEEVNQRCFALSHRLNSICAKTHNGIPFKKLMLNDLGGIQAEAGLIDVTIARLMGQISIYFQVYGD